MSHDGERHFYMQDTLFSVEEDQKTRNRLAKRRSRQRKAKEQLNTSQINDHYNQSQTDGSSCSQRADSQHDHESFSDVLQLDPYSHSLPNSDHSFRGSSRIDLPDQYYGSDSNYGNGWGYDNRSTAWLSVIEEQTDPEETPPENGSFLFGSSAHQGRDGEIKSNSHGGIQGTSLEMLSDFMAASSNSQDEWQFPGVLSNPKYPLHVASTRGHLEIATLLVESGAQVNAKDEYGRTALHYASSNNHEGLVEMLLLNGANLESLDNDGCTAVYYGAENGHEGIVKILIRYGATVNGFTI